jgi:hypothetical protein
MNEIPKRLLLRKQDEFAKPRAKIDSANRLPINDK